MVSPGRHTTAIAIGNAAKSIASDWDAVPSAHAVLPSSRAMNTPRRHTTAIANAAKSNASDWDAVPNDPTGEVLR